MTMSWRIEGFDPQLIRSTRRAVNEVVREIADGDSDFGATMIIIGELLANACEHGKFPVGVDIIQRDDALVLVVKDAGSGIVPASPADPDSTRGRGLEIVRKVGREVTILPPPVSEIRVVLPVSIPTPAGPG